MPNDDELTTIGYVEELNRLLHKLRECYQQMTNDLDHFRSSYLRDYYRQVRAMARNVDGITVNWRCIFWGNGEWDKKVEYATELAQIAARDIFQEVGDDGVSQECREHHEEQMNLLCAMVSALVLKRPADEASLPAITFKYVPAKQSGLSAKQEPPQVVDLGKVGPKAIPGKQNSPPIKQNAATPKRRGRKPANDDALRTLELWESGDFLSQAALAEHLGIDRSAVSLRLKRARELQNPVSKKPK